jgi:hypothetical protein
LALVVLAYRHPWLAIDLLAVLILLGLGGYWLQSKQQPGEVQISPEDVVFTAISIDPGYAGSWDLLARLHNQTLLTAVQEFQLRIEMFDCPPWAQSVSPTECEFMGEVVKSIPLNVAPRERKDFEVNLIFPPDLRPDLLEQPIHQLRWKYTVERVDGIESDTVGNRRFRFPDLSISHLLRHLVGTE